MCIVARFPVACARAATVIPYGPATGYPLFDGYRLVIAFGLGVGVTAGVVTVMFLMAMLVVFWRGMGGAALFDVDHVWSLLVLVVVEYLAYENAADKSTDCGDRFIAG